VNGNRRRFVTSDRHLRRRLDDISKGDGGLKQRIRWRCVDSAASSFPITQLHTIDNQNHRIPRIMVQYVTISQLEPGLRDGHSENHANGYLATSPLMSSFMKNNFTREINFVDEIKLYQQNRICSSVDW
jgi:hypothetical protein